MSRQPRKDNNEPKPLYERQLDEILRGAERTQQRRQVWTGLLERLGRLGRGGTSRRRAGGLPFSRLLLFGIGLAVAGVVLQSLVPALRGVSGWLILGGILLFLSPIVLSLGRPRGSGGMGDPGERLWRGRPVVYDTDPWRARFNSLLRWFRGGSNRPPPGPPPRRGRWN